MSTGEPWQKARVCVDKLHRLAGVLAASDVCHSFHFFILVDCNKASGHLQSCVSGPLSDKSMVPDAASLTEVINSGLLQSASQFAKRLAPVTHLADFNGLEWSYFKLKT